MFDGQKKLFLVYQWDRPVSTLLRSDKSKDTQIRQVPPTGRKVENEYNTTGSGTKNFYFFKYSIPVLSRIQIGNY